jgi:hypothetical protein
VNQHHQTSKVNLDFQISKRKVSKITTQERDKPVYIFLNLFTFDNVRFY